MQERKEIPGDTPDLGAEPLAQRRGLSRLGRLRRLRPRAGHAGRRIRRNLCRRRYGAGHRAWLTGRRSRGVGLRADPVHDHAERTGLLLVHPLLDPVDRLRDLLLELAALLAQGRSDGRPECDQGADEGQDDEAGPHTARNAESLEAIHPRGDGQPEQDAQEAGEEQRARHPDETRQPVQAHGQRGGPDDVAALPADLSLPSILRDCWRGRGGHPSAPEKSRWLNCPA